MFVAGVDAQLRVGLTVLRVWFGSGVSKPQAAFWTSLSTLVTELLDSNCAPWVMSPGGQSNLLLIRRLLHPSIPDFDPIRHRFFAQVLPNFSSTDSLPVGWNVRATVLDALQKPILDARRRRINSRVA